MNDLKISALPSDTARPADLLPVARDGMNFAVPVASITLLGGMMVAKVTLTPNDVMHLVNTPKQLIAAPGAGKRIYVSRVIVKLLFGTTVYAVGSQGLEVDLGAALDPSLNVALFAETNQPTTILTQGTSREMDMMSLTDNPGNTPSQSGANNAGNATNSPSLFENRPVVIRIVSAGVEEATNGDSSLKVIVIYQVVDLT